MIKAHIRVVENAEDVTAETIAPKETQVPKVVNLEAQKQDTNKKGEISSEKQEDFTTKTQYKNQLQQTTELKQVEVQESKEQQGQHVQQKELKVTTKTSEEKNVTNTNDKNVMQDKSEQMDQTVMRLEGYLQDKHCFGMILPDQDMRFCLQMEECKASGYGIAVSNSDEENIFYLFDQEGQNKAIEILEKSEKEVGVKIRVSGYIDGESIQIQTIEEIK